MDPGLALIRDLQQEVLTTMLRADGEEERTLVLFADELGMRWWAPLGEPGPEDHRVAYLEREVGALITERAPIAVAVGTPVRGVPEPHETYVIWAAERGGETMSIRMHPILTWDGELVPGPLGELDAVEAELAPTLVRALQAAG